MTGQIKKTVRWFIKLIAAMLIATVNISAFLLFYSFSGVHIRNDSGSTDYKYEPNQIISNLKEGFSFFQMDENGFNNANNTSGSKVDILLMGSSHIEACQVSPKENIGFLLNELLPDKRTYNSGMSGHTIYRLADNIDNAVAEYSPSSYVIVEISSVGLSVDSMREILEGRGKKIGLMDEGLFSVLQRVSAFTALYDQADRWVRKTGKISSSFRQKNDEPVEPSEPSKEYITTLNSFLGLFSSSCGDNRCVIVYIPPESLTSDGLVCSTDSRMLEAFADACENNKIIFVDCTSALEELHKQNIAAHGFSNGGVAVGHINKYGHEAVARLLAEKLD